MTLSHKCPVALDFDKNDQNGDIVVGQSDKNLYIKVCNAMQMFAHKIIFWNAFCKSKNKKGRKPINMHESSTKKQEGKENNVAFGS